MDKPSIGRLISAVFRHLKVLIEHELDGYQMNTGQIHFFMEIYKHPGMTQEELSHHLLVDKATTAKAIKKLLGEGYVLRKRDDADKRAYRLYVTESGKALFPELHNVLRHTSSILSDGFTETEFDQVVSYLDRMLDNMEKYRNQS